MSEHVTTLPVELVAHADWSINPSKRWITLAHRHESHESWRITPPQRVDALLSPHAPTHDLVERLARERGHTFIGLDLPLGVPRLIASQTELESFPQLLGHVRDGTPAWQEFLSPCTTREQISPYRPFYPHTPKGSKRAHLLQGLHAGQWQELLRVCDAPEAGGAKPCPVFWTVGASQVGKAAITGWRELLIPLMDHDHVVIWPFDGTLKALMNVTRARTIFAEVYPAEVYQWLDLSWGTHGKREQRGRQRAARPLLEALEALGAVAEPELRALITQGFGGGARGEDPFDSLVGVVGMLQVLGAERPLFEPEDSMTRSCEGWILGRHVIDQKDISMSDPIIVHIDLNVRQDEELFEDIFVTRIREALTISELGRIKRSKLFVHPGTKEPTHARVTMHVLSLHDKQIKGLVTLLEQFGAPAGSQLRVERDGDSQLHQVGQVHGIGVYLDGVNLDRKIYKKYDFDSAWDAINNELGDAGMACGLWHGIAETAIYAYGPDVDTMTSNLEGLLKKHPLFRGARVVRLPDALPEDQGEPAP